MDDEDSLIRGRQNDMRGNEMKPDYYDEFQCIADACSLTCCQEWKIAVDRKTAAVRRIITYNENRPKPEVSDFSPMISSPIVSVEVKIAGILSRMEKNRNAGRGPSEKTDLI